VYSLDEYEKHSMLVKKFAFLSLLQLIQGGLVVMRCFFRYLFFRMAMRFAGRLVFLVILATPLVWQGVQHRAITWLNSLQLSQSNHVEYIAK
jgi:hypothetical protein